MTLSADLIALVDAYGQQCFDESNLSGIAESMRHDLLSAIEALEKDAARVTELLEVIKLVRLYPDFDNGAGPLVDAMDQAVRGEPVRLLYKINKLAAGESAAGVDAAIDAAMSESALARGAP